MKTEEKFVTLSLKNLAMLMAVAAARQSNYGVDWSEKNWEKFIPAAELFFDSSFNVSGREKDIATEFYYHWHNSPGTNTAAGFDDWWEINKARFGE